MKLAPNEVEVCHVLIFIYLFYGRLYTIARDLSH